MKRIPQFTSLENELSTTTEAFFHKFAIGSLLKVAHAYKAKGIPVVDIFMTLFNLVFSGRSLYQLLKMLSREETFCCKNSFYRLLNCPNINWMRFTALLASRVTHHFFEPLTMKEKDKRVNVLILDDTIYERPFSKKAELVSRIYDHARHRYSYGFRLLTLGWSDGNSFLPVCGRLLASKEAKNRMCESSTKIDSRTCGGRARVQAKAKATDVLFNLLDEALKSGINAQYLLFDTWFALPSVISKVVKKHLDVIAMVKKSPKLRFYLDGEPLPVTEIYKRFRKRRGRSKYLLSVTVEMAVKENGIQSEKTMEKRLPVKLVYVRNRTNKGKYLVLLSTDTALPEEEIIRIYGKRWSIEVFFKACKSYLRLEKECRALSYDAMTAYTAIVFARYSMLSAEQRTCTDNRTMGDLFYNVEDELRDITWLEAFRLLTESFLESVTEKLFLTDAQMEVLIEAFISSLPRQLQNKLQKCA